MTPPNRYTNRISKSVKIPFKIIVSFLSSDLGVMTQLWKGQYRRFNSIIGKILQGTGIARKFKVNSLLTPKMKKIYQLDLYVVKTMKVSKMRCFLILLA